MIKTVISAVMAVALTACGGSGGNDIGFSTTNGLVGSPIAAAQFQYYREVNRAHPVSFIFTRDINGDGVEEVFFVAFETQPNDSAQYSNTAVQIFGWQNGQFVNLTSQWLPDQTHLVEGVGDLCFGDFNGDGRVDVFLSAYTDMSLSVHPYILINNGHSFHRVAMPTQAWMHSVACGDIDGDGFDDVVTAGWSDLPTYIGSPQGLVAYQGCVCGSSGVTLGQFLGFGNLQVVVTDRNHSPNDTELLSIEVDHTRKLVHYKLHSVLPPARLDLALNTPGAQHDIRVRNIDFDEDGRLDVVTFGYRYNAPVNTAHRGEISFFKNMGQGQFQDVTDSVRPDWDKSRMVGYFPQIKDVNGDGTLDIFVSQPVWESHSGITLLLNQQGKFRDSYQADLRSSVISSAQAAIAIGPGKQPYLVVEQPWSHDGQTRITVHNLKFNIH